MGCQTLCISWISDQFPRCLSLSYYGKDEGMIPTRITTSVAIALFGVLVISAVTGALEAYASAGLMSLVAHGTHDIYISTSNILSQQDCPPQHRDCENTPAQRGSTSNNPLGEEIPALRSPPG